MDVVAELTQALERFGPPFLGVLTFIETSTLLGLFVPAGVSFLLACFLTTQGTLSLPHVVVWALAGAVAGDTTGYMLGRRSGGAPAAPRGWLAKALARVGPNRLALLAGSPFYAVSLARVISFIRTLAPLTAGAAHMPYGRFAVFNALGIALWSATYVAVGTLAGESWQRVSGYVGGAWLAVFIAGAAVAFMVRKSRRRSKGRPLSVALTGNAASGKSTVAGLWRGQGVPVIDADRLARDAVAPGSTGLAAVVEAFGDDVVVDGTLDRAAMRDKVFADPEARRTLEAILHPRIEALRREWIEARAAEGHAVVVSEIPLLFEADLAEGFDAVVLVHVPFDVSRARLIEIRGLDPDQADGILGAQIPSEEKIERSDYVIRNLGSKGDLEDAAMHYLGQLRARAANRGQPNDDEV